MANEVKLTAICPAVFGITTSQYRSLAAEGHVPPPVKGKVDFVAATKSLLAYKDRLIRVSRGNAAGDRMKFTMAADYLGFSKQSLSYHVNRGKIKQESDGTFLRSELDRYRIVTGNVRGMDVDDASVASLKQKAELDLKQARAEREKLLLKQLHEEVAPVEEVTVAWAERIKELRLGLLNFENSLPPLLEMKSRHEIRHVLSRECRMMLDRYSRTGKWTPPPVQPMNS